MSTVSAPNRASYNNPFRPAVWGLAAILAFISLFVIWGYVAPLSSAAIAEGSLQVQAQRQTVQHPYGGVIARLAVSEGQYVERGQVLIELDGTEAEAKLDIARAEVVALIAQRARLICERDNEDVSCLEKFVDENELPAGITPEGVAEAVANEHAVMLARMHQYEAEKGMLLSRVAQLRERISGLEAQMEGLSKQNESLSEEVAGTRRLAAAGFAPRTRIMEMERATAEILADMGSRTAEIATAKQAISEAELAVARLDRERISDVTDQIRTTQFSLAEALPALKAAQDVMNRTVIKSPASGSIVDLSVFTEGGVIQPGDRLMDIVPDDNPIIVEARLPLSDINGVEPGAIADIRLTGVPRSERPILRGEVISVSADKITDTQSGVSYFAIRTNIDPEDLRKSKIALRPGMPAEVIIESGSRTLVGYLIGPLLDEVGLAFREE